MSPDSERQQRDRLVESSQFLGQMLTWRRPETGTNFENCLEEPTWRSHKSWDFDKQAMLGDAGRSLSDYSAPRKRMDRSDFILWRPSFSFC